MLLPAYRGQGIGKAFMEAREHHATEGGYAWAAFCAVERPGDHPRKPADYRPLHGFWSARGYRRTPSLATTFTFGEAPWSPAVDINIGRAGIFTPYDHGFPPDGVLTRAEDATPGWQLACLDLARICALRERGQVNNHADWTLQAARQAPGIARHALG